MQPIHQHNYEAYFLDFLEGNLSKAQEEELHLFLAKHPDLKVELDEMKLFYLEEDEECTFNKSKLIRNEETTLLQKEYLCIAAAEGVLTEDEKFQLDEQLKADSGLINELAIFQKTKLKPPEIVFPEKEKLKKRILPLFAWKSYISAAAAAALAIFLLNSPQAEQSYSPQNISREMPIEETIEDDLLSAKLMVREKQSTASVKKQIIKAESLIKRKENVVKYKLREANDLAQMEAKPLMANAIKPDLNPREPKTLQVAVKTKGQTDELPTVLEFAQAMVQEKLLKNKTIGDLITHQVSSFGEEKLKVKVEKNTNEDKSYFAINIGNFSFSRSK